MDDLRQVKNRHDALPDPSAETVAQARARLTAHMREAPSGKPSRQRSWRPVWGVGLVGAATAAVLAATLAGGGTGGDGDKGQSAVRLRPVASAQDLASNAAVTAAAEGGAMPKPHQWGYLKSLDAQTRVDGGPALRGKPKVTSTSEVWSRVDDWGYADHRNGKLSLHKGSERQVNYQDILALPQDPDKLLAYVFKTVSAGGSKDINPHRGPVANPIPMPAEERDGEAFSYINASMRDSALPAKLRAALYGAMAKIPGVGYEPHATDLAKRPGVTFYRIQGGYLRDEIFIDPKTYEYLGYRSLAVKTNREQGVDLIKGDIVTWSSVLKSAIVDEAGQRP